MLSKKIENKIEEMAEEFATGSESLWDRHETKAAFSGYKEGAELWAEQCENINESYEKMYNMAVNLINTLRETGVDVRFHSKTMDALREPIYKYAEFLETDDAK